MIDLLFWWLTSTLIALAAFPLAWRFFSRLPDRGFSFSRALGLLLAGYFYWIGAILDLLQVNRAGALGSLILLSGVAILAGFRQRSELWEWLRCQWRTLLLSELLFLLAFAFWALVRANNPEIIGTEKPMEQAFLNAILSSGAMPPADPWLSGYAISYYYFGYVLLALLTQLAGSLPAVAFNLGNALWFALVCQGVYGLLLNLLSLRHGRLRPTSALLGPLFVLISGNLGGWLESLSARGLFWTQAADGAWQSGFWSWLNLKDLDKFPLSASSWVPERYYWWWRASRVVRDVNLAGADVEVIDEFPMFSFVLADNHPHLLAVPFVLLALAFVLQVLLQRVDPQAGMQRSGGRSVNFWRWGRPLSGVILAAGVVRSLGMLLSGVPLISGLLAGLRLAALGFVGLGMLGLLWMLARGQIRLLLPAGLFWLAALIFGGLAFLNTWDFPIYLSLLLGVFLLADPGKEFAAVMARALLNTFLVTLAAVALYLPWYPSFSSQLGGVLPNLIYPTRLPHFLVMFAVPAFPLIGWLIRSLKQQWKRGDGRQLLLLGVGLPLLLWLSSLLFAWVISLAAGQSAIEAALAQSGAPDFPAFLQALAERRLGTSPTVIVLGLISAAAFLLLRKGWTRPARKSAVPWEQTVSSLFVTLLIGIGALLVLAPEYFYLRDFFGTRMNTVFKFYYAAWILWGTAAAYAAAEIWPRPWAALAAFGAAVALAPQMLTLAERAQRGEFGTPSFSGAWINLTLYLLLLLGLLIAAIVRLVRQPRQVPTRLLAIFLLLPLFFGLIYPVQAIWTKTGGFGRLSMMTLDGTAYLADFRPAEHDAIRWINAHLTPGVMAEAVGGSYSEFARIATHTGMQTILGWEFHEIQWRGGSELLGSRKADMQRLYQSRSWSEAAEIIERYAIDYVYVGPLEHAAYAPLQTTKFDGGMRLIYQQDGIAIYAMPGREVK